MGSPPCVNPQGSEIAGNPHTLNGRVFRSSFNSAGRSASGFALQLRDRRSRNRHGRRHQHIDLREHSPDVAPRLVQFSPLPDVLRRRNFFARSNAPQCLRLVQLRILGDALSVVGIRLRRLQCPVGRYLEPHILHLGHQRFDSAQARVPSPTLLPHRDRQRNTLAALPRAAPLRPLSGRRRNPQPVPPPM